MRRASQINGHINETPREKPRSAWTKPTRARAIAKLRHCKDRLLASIWDPSNDELRWDGVRPAPYRKSVSKLLEILFAIAFPGFSGRSKHSILYQTGKIEGLVDEAHDLLTRLILTLYECWPDENTGDRATNGTSAPDAPSTHFMSTCQDVTSASKLAVRFLEGFPACRSLWVRDLEAALEGDPAATHRVEILSCYPGFYAMFVYRSAHLLHTFGVPLLPRMMTEIAHSRTGIDIHPGAVIGPGLFIDHGTGTVIGATCEIGENCRLYQGVTLGARKLEVLPGERALRHGMYKRHPTLKDRVIVYSNASILGGDVVIGSGAVIGANAVVTQSVGDNQVRRTLKPEESARTGQDDELISQPAAYEAGSGV